MEYCDILATTLISGIKRRSDDLDVRFTDMKTKLDLHPVGGYMVSTKKTVTCQDNQSNQYRITIEANPEATLARKLEASNFRHSRNGDQISYLMDQLRLKLAFSEQDSSILADISDEELEALQCEINAIKNAKETSVEHF